MNWHHPHAVGRRALFGQWAVIAVFVVLVAAFFRVQVLAQDRYRLQSEENRLRPVRMPAPRGLIVDRNGVVLAENVPGYSIAVLASSVDVLRDRLEQVAPMIGLDRTEIEAIIERFRRRPHEPAPDGRRSRDRDLPVRQAPGDLVSRHVTPRHADHVDPPRRSDPDSHRHLGPGRRSLTSACTAPD